MKFIICGFILFIGLVSCGDKKQAKKVKESWANKPVGYTDDVSGNVEVDTTYMITGFYYLADGTRGVRMVKAHTNEIYGIEPTPFASVKNVKEVKMERKKSENNFFVDLCLTMDNHGMQDLINGTGNPEHHYIAIVVGGKLLYVVKSDSKVKTGKMCIGVEDYSEDEIKAMQNAIENKL